jgi:folate-dependent phosphoribosylglycinamide formyltransferase PurN
MLIVSPELCLKYNMLNLHPAPPGGPAGSWQEVIWTLIKNKADTAGAMMHLATPELDKGPIITYCLFTITGKPFAKYWQMDDKDMLFQLIRKHELAREFPLITLTLQSLSRGEVSIKDRKVVDAQGKTIEGYDLSARIDLAVEGKIA